MCNTQAHAGLFSSSFLCEEAESKRVSPRVTQGWAVISIIERAMRDDGKMSMSALSPRLDCGLPAHGPHLLFCHL